MNRRLRNFIGFAISCSFLCSCGPNLTPIQSALEKQDWDAALHHTQNDPELESHLAALLIESKAIHYETPKQWVLALRTETRAGTRAIERISDRNEKIFAVQMARLVRYRSKNLSRNPTLKYLESENSDVRALAATTLSSYLSPKQLRSMMVDLNSIVRGAAVAALCRKTTDNESRATLSERLRTDPMPHVRASAARCAGKLGNSAFSLLKDTVTTDQNEGVVKAAISGLMKLSTTDSILFLKSYSTGPMTPLKLHAAVELAENNIEQGEQRVADALNNSDEEIRADAISHLHRIPQIDAATVYRKALEDSDMVAFAAAKAMSKINTLQSEAIGYLEQRLRLGKNAEDTLLLLAVLAQSDAINDVKKRLANENSQVQTITRFSAIASLRDSFVTLMAHKNEGVRLAAAVAVLRLTDE